MNNNQRIKLKIHGQVQGVFYRTEAREKARELDLKGIARNESDGTVIIIAEGPRQNLEKFIQWCYRGSSGAVINKIDIEWGEASKEYKDFKINY